MLYLNQQSIVHRDLALRNLLVAQGDKPGMKYIIKIAGEFVFLFILHSIVDDLMHCLDFGMARIMKKEYYRTEDKAIPVRWCAPEALEFGKFSSHSGMLDFNSFLSLSVCVMHLLFFGCFQMFGLLE